MNHNRARTQTRFNLDIILAFSDEELRQNYKKLKYEIETSNPTMKTLRHLETDVCYIQRELQVRESRKRAHRNFVQARFR